MAYYSVPFFRSPCDCACTEVVATLAAGRGDSVESTDMFLCVERCSNLGRELDTLPSKDGRGGHEVWIAAKIRSLASQPPRTSQEKCRKMQR